MSETILLTMVVVLFLVWMCTVIYAVNSRDPVPMIITCIMIQLVNLVHMAIF